jgi:hypothetical protein
MIITAAYYITTVVDVAERVKVIRIQHSETLRYADRITPCIALHAYIQPQLSLVTHPCCVRNPNTSGTASLKLMHAHVG